MIKFVAVPPQGTLYVVTSFIFHVKKWRFLHVDIMTCSLFHVFFICLDFHTVYLI